MTRSDDAFGFAIVGTGDAGRRHARAIARVHQTRLVSVYDTVPERALQFTNEFGGTPSDELEALFARRDIEAVSICTPPSTHVSLALAAVAQGKHILVEKPFALDIRGIDAVRAAAQARGVCVGAVSQHRFSRAAALLGESLQTGKLGRVIAGRISVRRRRTPDYYLNGWKGDRHVAGGGTLFSLGVHMLDLACSLMGRPREALAVMSGDPAGTVESVVAGALLFGSSATLALDMATGTGPTQPDEFELFCEGGRALIVGDELRLDGELVAAGGENLHERQIEAYVRSLLEGRPPMPGPSEIRPTIAAITALYASSSSGRRESIQE